jgi:hypothetical protein
MSETVEKVRNELDVRFDVLHGLFEPALGAVDEKPLPVGQVILHVGKC